MGLKTLSAIQSAYESFEMDLLVLVSHKAHLFTEHCNDPQTMKISYKYPNPWAAKSGSIGTWNSTIKVWIVIVKASGFSHISDWTEYYRKQVTMFWY